MPTNNMTTTTEGDTLAYPISVCHTSACCDALQVNEHLQARCYLVGSSATLADLVVFGTIHAAVVSYLCFQAL
jgi:hypothetical protein